MSLVAVSSVIITALESLKTAGKVKSVQEWNGKSNDGVSQGLPLPALLVLYSGSTYDAPKQGTGASLTKVTNEWQVFLVAPVTAKGGQSSLSASLYPLLDEIVTTLNALNVSTENERLWVTKREIVEIGNGRAMYGFLLSNHGSELLMQ